MGRTAVKIARFLHDLANIEPVYACVITDRPNVREDNCHTNITSKNNVNVAGGTSSNRYVGNPSPLRVAKWAFSSRFRDRGLRVSVTSVIFRMLRGTIYALCKALCHTWITPNITAFQRKSIRLFEQALGSIAPRNSNPNIKMEMSLSQYGRHAHLPALVHHLPP